MRLPLSWLNEFVKVDDIEPKELAEKLTRAGLQVEGIETVGGEGLSDLIVVAEVLECEAHPNSDHLHVCKVTDGKETFQVVCGAPNMRQGIKTAFAKIGAPIPGFLDKSGKPEKIKKGSPSPDDFDVFWANAREKLAREVPLDAQMELVPERSTKDFDFFRISFATFGRRVYGYMSVPTDKSKAPYPVDVGVAAAGFGNWSNDMSGSRDSISAYFSVYPFAPHWKWQEQGLKREYDGMASRLREKYGIDSYRVAGLTVSREDYFFYPVILGLDRAVDWIAARPDVDAKRIRYQGTSQGGGFGLYLAGLNRHFTKVGLYVPALTDTMGYRKGRQSGWPQPVESFGDPVAKAAAEANAPYFDGANFAARIRCPVRVAVGFADVTCPPCAVYSAFNAIPVKDKAIYNGIGMSHSCRQDYYGLIGKWIRE